MMPLLSLSWHDRDIALLGSDLKALQCPAGAELEPFSRQTEGALTFRKQVGRRLGLG